jgi:hypothetical protein
LFEYLAALGKDEKVWFKINTLALCGITTRVVVVSVGHAHSRRRVYK